MRAHLPLLALIGPIGVPAYAKRFADNDPVVRQQVTLPNVIAIPGGPPVRVGAAVIGGG